MAASADEFDGETVVTECKEEVQFVDCAPKEGCDCGAATTRLCGAGRFHNG
jgi:hypothetical protein